MGTGEGAVASQRWRLVLARAAGTITQRDHEVAWEAALESSGLPCLRGTSGRRAPRITFAVPLPVGVQGEAELAEILLVGRLRSADVRAALLPVLPPGTALRDLHDVWLGAPGLPSLVVAADYRIELHPGVSPDGGPLRVAVDGLLDAVNLSRVRGTDRRYDLRPLIAGLSIEDGPLLRARLRHDQALGTGRPDELLAALGEQFGAVPEVRSIVRERLILADEDGDPPAP